MDVSDISYISVSELFLGNTTCLKKIILLFLPLKPLIIWAMCKSHKLL